MNTVHLVSIGDSFTEGLSDRGPDGKYVGRAGRVAVGLAAAHPDEPVWYANLAVRGRLIEAIAGEQFDAAFALDPPPTHLTFNGGGNDMLRPGYSDERMAALFTRVLEKCADAGVHLSLLSGPDPSDRLPAGRDGVTFVDNFRDLESRRAVYLSDDRLHLNALGHERVASRVLTAMGVPTPAPDVSAVPPPRTGPIREVGYYARYVVPWLLRRMSGKSSRDRRRPKYPDWVRVGAGGTRREPRLG